MMKIRRMIVEQIEIEIPMGERMKAFDYCKENNFRIIRSGPKIKEWPIVDSEVCFIFAERELVDEEER